MGDISGWELVRQMAPQDRRLPMMGDSTEMQGSSGWVAFHDGGSLGWEISQDARLFGKGDFPGLVAL